MLFWSVAVGCASDRPPSGGPVDSSPLQIISSEPRYTAAGFSSETMIRITFSHPVSGRELLKALVISPSVDNYDIAARGKTAEIRIFEPLKPGSTYRIILNKYIRDIRGRNLDNTAIIAFSTGPVTDASVIAGKVYLYNLKPASDALLLAFSKSDSGTEPDYLVQTGTDGSFQLDHLAAGKYRIIAVKDTNRDLRFDRSSETVAVPDRALVATGTRSIMLRFPADEITRSPSTSAEEPDPPGTLSGICKADAQALTVEARRHKDDASFLTSAIRTATGIFRYSFPSLPPGTYTVSASIPSEPKQNKQVQAWKPGRLDPFTPSEVFGIYPDTVRIRPEWVTDAIDFSIRP